jgi:hypothetical protein
MRLSEINRASTRLMNRSDDAEVGVAEASRALVTVSPVALVREPSANFRQAPFLAQLIANKDQHPQTRERRRAEPEEVLAAYRAVKAITG